MMNNHETVDHNELPPDQNQDEAVDYNLTEEERAALPESAIYSLALVSKFMQRDFTDVREIEQVIKAETGLDEKAQKAARDKMRTIPQEGPGFHLERNETGIKLVLTPTGKKKLAEEIAKVKKDSADSNGKP